MDGWLMPRANFSKLTKREAWERSGGRCEAVGPIYGLDKGLRCNADLKATGVNYDHFNLDANSKDNSLKNCRAVCPPCHAWKTNNIDKPKAAKTLRQQDKARGIEKEKPKMPNRGKADKKTEKVAALAALGPPALARQIVRNDG